MISEGSFHYGGGTCGGAIKMRVTRSMAVHIMLVLEAESEAGITFQDLLLVTYFYH